MRTMCSVTGRTVCALLLAVMSAVPATAARQASTETSPGFFDAEAITEGRAALHSQLVAARVDSGMVRPILATPSRAALNTVVSDRGPRRMVGTMVPAVASAAIGRRDGFGSTRVERNGWVWTGAVESVGAKALRLSFSEFYLPAGAELFIYNEAGSLAGPYSGRGPKARGSFLSHTIFGSSAILQVQYSGPDGPRALANARLSLAGVGHLTERFTFGAMQNPSPEEDFCSFNENCVENAQCSSIPSAIAPAQDAVGHMLFRSGQYFYICSGGLLADNDMGSQIPYFLTANHCISKNNEAASLEAFFQFTTNCNGSCYDPDGVVPSTLGSSIVAKERATDFTLLRLDQAAPAGSAFLGWTATPVAFSNGTNLYRVSHPSGAPQAYSEQEVDTSAGTCGGWPRGDRIYSRDTYGATEGGSSGSPVMNSAGQVVGQLSGACGTNVNDPCDAASNATVDGAFAEYYSKVEPYLDAGGGCTDSDADGYCMEDDCDDFDPAVNPGAAEVCDDGIDNDCDGLIDSSDPECGTCQPQGSSCTSDSQCCSNKCKGPPNNKTCR